MTPLDWFAAFLLVLHIPVPLYWLIVHPFIAFWRRRGNAAFWFAGLFSWGVVFFLLYQFRHDLLHSAGAPLPAVLAGFALVALDVYLIAGAEKALGLRRLVGKTELEGRGELVTTGIFSRIRHPRYTGMFLSVLGACLMAGTMLLWIVALVWWLLALLFIFFEERELRARFGPAFDDYARRVPRFLPFRFFPRND
ncbi:MAG TPA: isoprenylcysteine carboxylmethyltransferase family protein [Candidatus Acidoferrales bacterium]|nr:isoprenylcysteine carboxylmethyltransferase family protein [Candidatus Acidoferrales bacterium]